MEQVQQEQQAPAASGSEFFRPSVALASANNDQTPVFLRQEQQKAQAIEAAQQQQAQQAALEAFRQQGQQIGLQGSPQEVGGLGQF